MKNTSPSQADVPAFESWLERARASYQTSELGIMEASTQAWRKSSETAAGSPNEPSEEIAWNTADCLVTVHAPVAAVLAGLFANLVSEHQVAPHSFEEEFGPEVVKILEGVSRLAQVHWDRIDEAAAETLRRMFLAMAQDMRVVLVILAQRVAMIRQLGRLQDTGALDDSSSLSPATETAHHESEFLASRERFARETLEVFAPLANRLGIWQFKWELEDGALRVLQPESWAEITRLLAERRDQREAFIHHVVGVLQERLSREGVPGSVQGRPKHIYSIYRKMQRKQISFDELHDVSAVRVITERVADCYSALGIVHSLWTPVPGEFDDYIALPKNNGYQSLHTVVIGPQGRPVEIQIRTEAMHRFAELGIAAHWAYKEGQKADTRENQRILFLRQLMDWEREVTDPKQFVEALKADWFEDRVYVFTPNGDVVDLPRGATPVDFAYRIHTMVGHRCRGARVNGQIVQLDSLLKTGDRVEILTHKTPQPNRDWMSPSLGFVKTASARAKVRHWFREQSRERAIREGEELIHKELAKIEGRGTSIAKIAERLGYASTEDLYAAVGYGDRRPKAINAAALALSTPSGKDPVKELPEPRLSTKASAQGLSLDGVGDILAKRGRCCNPVPGDDVVGFITRGRGVVIHRRDCVQLEETEEPERIVSIDWGTEESERHPVKLEVHAYHAPNRMLDLVNKVSSLGVQVVGAETAHHSEGLVRVQFLVECRNAEELKRVIERLEREPTVLQVRRTG